MGLEPEYKEKIVALLSALFPEAKIYLYGSRARDKEMRASDIDIAIDEGKPIDFGRIGEAKDVLGALYIPYAIDLVDIHRVPQEMRNIIYKEGVVWKR